MGCGSSQNKGKTPAVGNTNPGKETITKLNEAETFPPKKPTDLENKKEEKIFPADENKRIRVLFLKDKIEKDRKDYKSDILVEEIVKAAEAYFINNWTREQIIVKCESKNLRELSKSKLVDVSYGKPMIRIEIEFLGLPIAHDIIKEFSKINFIAKPLLDTHEILIYDIKKAKMSVKPLNEETFINKIHLTSSYCNGGDYLFVSGGESDRQEEDSEKVLTNSFLEINLNGKLSLNSFENEQGLLNPRKSHSMIFVPNEFVFIVGGADCLCVEYFDIKSKKFVLHSELNEERIEPALSLIDNSYLYCFSGFSYSKTFERINLRTNLKKWDLIEVKLAPEISKFNNMFFAVSYYKNDSVIFLGGLSLDYENSKNNFAFNYKTDTLYLTEKEKEDFESSEKFFIPIQKLTGINIPNFYEKEIKLLVWNDNSLAKADFTI